MAPELIKEILSEILSGMALNPCVIQAKNMAFRTQRN